MDVVSDEGDVRASEEQQLIGSSGGTENNSMCTPVVGRLQLRRQLIWRVEISSLPYCRESLWIQSLE
jgi:hypothetical protein